MKYNFKPKTRLIAILMLAIAFGLISAVIYYEFGLKKNVKIIRASAADNVTGFAWNANTGWISFNCTGENPSCGSSDYGVKVDSTTGQFSGYAWSANLGWISFNRRTCVGGADAGKYCGVNNNCTSNNCSLVGPGAAGAPLSDPYVNPSLRYNAIYSYANNQVTGWAKILSLGDNGWIKLRKFSTDTGAAYGVSINPVTGDFTGWAWNANDNGVGGLGWISFNCANESPACSGTNYKVTANINRRPTVASASMTAPNWNINQAGQSGALNAYLGWVFSDQDVGSSELAYQIIVSKQNNINIQFFNSGKCVALGGKCTIAPGAGDQFPLQLALLADGKTLDYKTAYYWWIKVWDNHNLESAGWTQYNVNPDFPLEANDGVNNRTFTTYKHEMPEVDFDWFPVKPSKGEEVMFTDMSQAYLSSAPAVAVDCSGGSVSCSWEWTAPGASIVGGATAAPVMTFNSVGNFAVTLKITDQDGYYASRTKTVEVINELPNWKEVKPE